MRASTGVEGVAIVHDYLTQRGGAERVVLALAEAFPDAPIHTSLFHPEGTFAEFSTLDVRPSPLNKSARLRHNHRLALPLLAPTFEAMTIDAPVTICSSSGWAHGVRCAGRRLVYCYAPARWLYQGDTYLAEQHRFVRWGMQRTIAPLRHWDRRAAGRADRYVTISSRSRELIRQAYGFDAEIVYPPYGLDPHGQREPVDGLDPGFYLCVSRLLPYKNVDLLLAAFEKRPTDRLVVVGTGPDEQRLRKLAPANVHFAGRVSDDQLRWLYAEAAALIAASFEDLGLTTIEAAALGTPAAVLRFGGYLDTVIDGETGEFFDEREPQLVNRALDRLAANPPAPQSLRDHASEFSPDRFTDRMRALVDELGAMTSAVQGERP
ncbi:MAG: glycosyltransferase [Acidimicrobiia bacterium]|nr:glycosyltransferase [Acidimicrobiia bacterium]